MNCLHFHFDPHAHVHGPPLLYLPSVVLLFLCYLLSPEITCLISQPLIAASGSLMRSHGLEFPEAWGAALGCSSCP